MALRFTTNALNRLSVREALERAGWGDASVEHISTHNVPLLDETVMSRKPEKKVKKERAESG